MFFFNKNKILDTAKSFFYNGFFFEGLYFLKSKRLYFFFNNYSNKTKSNYLFLYGAFLTNTGKYKKGLIYLKKALSGSYDDKSEIYYYIINTYISLYENEKVIYYFSILAERAFSPFYLILSYYKCIKNKINLNITFDSIKELENDSKESLEDILSSVLLMMLENKTQDAYKMILDIEAAEFKEKYYYKLIFFTLLFQTKKYQQIVDYFKDNNKNIISMDILKIYSATLYKLELFEESKKVLEDILILRPNHPEALLNIAKICYRKKKYTETLELLKKAVKIKSSCKDEILFLLSVTFGHLGLLNEAFKSIKNIKENTLIYFKALFNLSLIYHDLNYYDEAKETFSKIDKQYIPSEKYYNCGKIILFDKEKNPKTDKVNYIIKFLPLYIIIFSGIVFVILYFFIK